MKQHYSESLEERNCIETQDLIVCPYCGHETELGGDYFDCENEYKEDIECASCEKEFEAHLEVVFLFWSKTKKKNDM